MAMLHPANGMEPMDLTTIAAAFSLVLADAAPAGELALPPPQRDIALRVAGAGHPVCTSYHKDGTTGPCLPRFTVRRGTAINGWSTSGTIAFSTAAVSTLDADAFALLAGHEIAHWYLGHSASTSAAELAADRLGAALACRAGYDVMRGLALLRHVRRGGHHPARAARIAAARVQCGSSAPARIPDSAR